MKLSYCPDATGIAKGAERQSGTVTLKRRSDLGSPKNCEHLCSGWRRLESWLSVRVWFVVSIRDSGGDLAVNLKSLLVGLPRWLEGALDAVFADVPYILQFHVGVFDMPVSAFEDDSHRRARRFCICHARDYTGRCDDGRVR